MKLLCLVMAILLGTTGALALAEGGAALTAQIEAMQPAMDSVLRAMCEREDGRYAPDDADFVWSVLYMMGENFPLSHPDVRLNEDDLVVVPVAAQLAFLHAAFAELEETPVMSDFMQGMERFDPSALEFTLAGSDRGETSTVVGDYTANDDGTVTVPLSLVDPTDGTEITKVVFTLTPNEGAEPFAYRILAAE